MIKALSLMICILLTHAIAVCQLQNGSFKITGKLSGFTDSTLLYLDDTDSTYIVGNQFYFNGSLKEKTKSVLLRTKDYSDYKFFWIENSLITFTARKGHFREALINGSATQNDQNKLDVAIKTTKNEKDQSILFILKHPNSIISASILSTYASTWGRDTSAMLYSKLSSNIKNTSYGRSILEFITLSKNLKIGDKYANFTQANTVGENISLSDYAGKVTLLEFWGSWCGPCRKSHPELIRTFNEFKVAGFDILGVASDSKKEAWLEAVEMDGLKWQNVSDLKGDKNVAALIYSVSYYPTNFLIDKSGTIIARDITGDQLKDKLRELLK